MSQVHSLPNPFPDSHTSPNSKLYLTHTIRWPKRRKLNKICPLCKRYDERKSYVHYTIMNYTIRTTDAR